MFQDILVTQPAIHPKGWGRELWIANSELYCGKILELQKGKRCSIHYHKIKDETFYILSGYVKILGKTPSFRMELNFEHPKVPNKPHPLGCGKRKDFVMFK